ncbi:MAG: hypothetical protein ACQETD_02640, partial [Pseudomonadota bacterium]
LGEGRGLVNIRRRAEELGGESRIRIEQDRFTVHTSVGVGLTQRAAQWVDRDSGSTLSTD